MVQIYFISYVYRLTWVDGQVYFLGYSLRMGHPKIFQNRNINLSEIKSSSHQEG